MASALEILISDYLSANNHLASDGYANGDAEKLVEAAKAERIELLEALEAVLIFHSGGEWSGEKRGRWFAIAQTDVATTKTLCNLIRSAMSKEKAVAQ